MAQKKYNEDLLLKRSTQDVYGPTKGTQSPYGLESEQAAANIEQLNNRYGITPNPVTSTQGGAMTQGANGITASGGGNAMTQNNAGAGNLMGVRSTLNKRGIYDIGWNGSSEEYTVGGQSYKPASVQDGTSYDSSANINKVTNDYYRNAGRPLEGADAYVAQALGVGNAVTWSDGNLMVGGQIVPTVYVDENGTAYAEKSALDNAINAYRKSTGLTGNQSILDNWNSRYGNKINNALNRVMDRDEWSYNPEDDAAYRAYRDQYIREGDRAYQDAYAAAAANSSGYGSSAAMNAAGQNWNYYMQQLGDRIPELQQNDYNRYLGEYDLRRKELDSLRDVADDYYNKEYQANRDIISDLNAANEASYNRRLDARKLNRSDYVSDRLWDIQKQLYGDELKKSAIDTERYGTLADLDIESKQLENWQAKVQNILTKNSYQADPDMPISQADAEVIGIAPKADGTYPSMSDIERTYGSIQVLLDLIMWEQVTKPQTLWTYQLNKGVY